MFELIKNEFRRFKKWLLIAASLNSLFIFSGIYFDDYEQSGLAVGVAFTLLYGLASALFGAYQMRSYRSVNMWTYLINRPAKIEHIGLALIAAAGLLLICAWVIPYLLLTFLVDVLDVYIIDRRHYLQAIYLSLVVINFYLTACFISLSNNKVAYAAWIFPVLTFVVLIGGGPIIGFSLLACLWLLLLLLGEYKSNLSSQPQSRMQAVGMGIPFFLGAYFVLSIAVALSYQVSLMLIDGAGIKVAWNHYFADDTLYNLSYANSDKQVSLGLTGLTEQQTYYQRQIARRDSHAVKQKIEQFAVVQQMPYQQQFNQMSLPDAHNETLWIYSHDAQGFLSRPLSSKFGITKTETKLSGQQTAIDQMAFNTPPVIMGKQVISPTTIHWYDAYSQHLDLRMQVDNSESLLTGFERKGSHYVVLTTAMLYLFDPIVVNNSQGVIEPLIAIPLPLAYENLNEVAIAELMDSTLVSFLYGKLGSTGQYPLTQMTYQLAADYTITPMNNRELKQGFSAYYRYRDFYLSPLVHVLYEKFLAKQLVASSPQPIQTWQFPPISSKLWAVIASISLLSVVMTFLHLRRRSISLNARNFQLLVAALTSLVGLLFCWLYYNKKSSASQPVSFK